MPRLPCTIPTIPWSQEQRIPENFKENRKWNVTILNAPECPPTEEILRLIKTAPFNFDLRKVLKIHRQLNKSVRSYAQKL